MRSTIFRFPYKTKKLIVLKIVTRLREGGDSGYWLKPYFKIVAYRGWGSGLSTEKKVKKWLCTNIGLNDLNLLNIT